MGRRGEQVRQAEAEDMNHAKREFLRISIRTMFCEIWPYVSGCSRAKDRRLFPSSEFQLDRWPPHQWEISSFGRKHLPTKSAPNDDKDCDTDAQQRHMATGVPFTKHFR